MYKYLKEYAVEDILMILFWLVYLINLIQISGLREVMYVFQMILLLIDYERRHHPYLISSILKDNIMIW